MKIISFFLAFLLVFQSPLQLKVKAEEMDETSAIALPAVGLTVSAVSGIATKYVGSGAVAVGTYVLGQFAYGVAESLVYGFLQKVFEEDEELATYYYDCIFDESITNISIENFYAEGYDLTLYNNLLLGGEFPENTSGTDLTFDSTFNTWRAVPPGVFEQYSGTESDDVLNDSTIGLPTVQLMDPGSLNLRYYNPTYTSTTPNGLQNYFTSYFASGLFRTDVPGSLSLDLFNLSQTVHASQNLSVGLVNASTRSRSTLYLVEYQGDYVLRGDENFLNVTSNPYWELKQTSIISTNSTTVTFDNLDSDTNYCIILGHSIVPVNSATGRILSHQYFTPRLRFRNFNGSTSIPDSLSFPAQSENSTFQNYVKTQYNNYYVSGDWYEGDNNSGGSSGGSSGDSSGSGSGSTNVDGSLDVNVSGGLNGSIDHSGDVDININLPGIGGETTEEEYEANKFTFENMIMKFLNFLLDCLITILGIAFSPFISFFEMIVEKFQELVHVQIFELFASVFSFLPEEILTTISFAFSILMLLGIVRFFI